MNYSMRTPCPECPFLKGSGFALSNLLRHARGEFGCHKLCDVDDEEGTFEPNEKTPHCAGALIFLEKLGRPHQMMRICERLGLYDASKLNMDAPVGTKASDFRRKIP